MDTLYDIKPIFEFAKAYGDVKIVDRILIKTLPILLKNKLELSAAAIDESAVVSVPAEIYQSVKVAAEDLTNKTFAG